MEDPFDILLLDVVEDAYRERIRRLVREDPEARRIALAWIRLSDQVRGAIEADVPDRDLVVLEGIRRAGREGLLTREERARLDRSAGQLAVAAERHPFLEDVLIGVEKDVDAFEQIWREEATAEARRTRTADAPRTRAAGRAPRRGSRRSTRWLWRTTSALAIVAFAAVIVFLTQRDTGLVTIATGAGEVRQIELADGSSVRLLEHSTLAYHAPGTDAQFVRFARLEGDAFFDIRSDREGFKVEAPTAEVIVLGTTFGMRAGEDAAEVFLASGRLSVSSHSARSRAVLLEAGYMTRVEEGQPPVEPEPVELSSALAWTGLLVFRETMVAEAAARLEQTYDAAISVDPELGGETVTGTFDQEQPLKSILSALSAALDAEMHRDADGTYRIAPAPRSD